MTQAIFPPIKIIFISRVSEKFHSFIIIKILIFKTASTCTLRAIRMQMNFALSNCCRWQIYARENQFLSLFSFDVTCSLLISLSPIAFYCLQIASPKCDLHFKIAVKSDATHKEIFRALSFRENSAFALSHRVHIYLLYMCNGILSSGKRTLHTRPLSEIFTFTLDRRYQCTYCKRLIRWDVQFFCLFPWERCNGQRTHNVMIQYVTATSTKVKFSIHVGYGAQSGQRFFFDKTRGQ